MLLKPDSRAFASSLARGVFFVLLIGLASCGKEEDDEELTVPLAATYDSMWANVFSGRCNTCHAPGKDSGTAGGPDMSTKDSFYTQLVGKKGSDYPAWDTFVKNRDSCKSFEFINEGAADQSLLVSVLSDSAPVCTVKNHLEGPQNVVMSAQVFTLLKEWINKGAPR